MPQKTTIRLQITPSEVLASLHLVEKLGGSTENRTFSSVCEQLYLSMLKTAMQNSGMKFLPDAEASLELKTRRERATLSVIPIEELSLDQKVEEQIKEARAQKIKESLEDYEPNIGEDFLSILRSQKDET